MAGYRGHIAAGVMFYLLVLVIVSSVMWLIGGGSGAYFLSRIWEIPAQMIVAILAALWPDIDVMSYGRRIYYRIFLVVDIILIATGRWLAAALLGLFAMLPQLGRHRGWTHTMWAALLLPLPIILVPMFLQPDWSFGIKPNFSKLGFCIPYYVAAITGYISHLAADSMLGGTFGRVTQILLYPILRKKKPSVERDHPHTLRELETYNSAQPIQTMEG